MPPIDDSETTRPGPLREGESHSPRRGAVLRWVVLGLIGMTAWWGTYRVALRLLPGASLQRTWSAADGTPVPNDFLFLMFPVDDAVPLYDSPGGKRVGVLRRALGNDHQEITESQWIQVPADKRGDPPAFVRLSDLRYLSANVLGTAPPLNEVPIDQRVNYVGAFAKAYMSRAPGEGREVQFIAHQSRPPGLDREAGVGLAEVGENGRYVTLTLKANKNRRVFNARVSGDKAVPLAIDRLSEGSRAYTAVMRSILAACAAIAVGFVAVAGAESVRRRLSWGERAD
ncbi:MAG TPA: hypothetical protein VEB22_06775 [Phycisphaerales bacterium]|nr:hypothetical protein [Phycisphaerales bacterium]